MNVHMHLCTYMCVCVHACMYVCMCAYVCVCVYVSGALNHLEVILTQNDNFSLSAMNSGCEPSESLLQTVYCSILTSIHTQKQTLYVSK
jgi:hypothetical protein